MPLPANVTTVTVVGTYLTPDGQPSTGTVSFKPSAWLTNSGDNSAIPNSTVTKALDAAGSFSVVLPITDDPDLAPGAWSYVVEERIEGLTNWYTILIPSSIAGGGTVYLADIVPVVPDGPAYYSLQAGLSIGTVTTLAIGAPATASISGLAPNQVLDLGIPAGPSAAILVLSAQYFA
jgi:hypothetical protein